MEKVNLAHANVDSISERTEPDSQRTGPKVVPLALDYLKLDERLQSRRLNDAVVSDYAAAMRRGEVFPPIRVVRCVDDTYYPYDGYHRIAARHQINGLDTIQAEIIEGNFDDALWRAWGSNRTHGLRRTNEQKRQIVYAVLQHPEWKKKSNRAIAKHVGCDHKTVAPIRRLLEGGEFPRPVASSVGRSAGSAANDVLKACRLLAGVQVPASVFDEDEIVLIRSGYDTLQRIQTEFSAEPISTREQAGSEGGSNA